MKIRKDKFPAYFALNDNILAQLLAITAKKVYNKR